MRKSAKKITSIHHRGAKMSFTAVFMKVPEGYVGFVEELPGANTQGKTLSEARRNLREAVCLVLEANRKLAEREIADKSVIREKIEVPLS
jgi:predicted RNase H-like HicB family nuclease